MYRVLFISALVAFSPLTLCPPAHAAPIAINSPEARRLGGLVDDMLLALENKDIKALDPIFDPEMRALWSNGKQFRSAEEIKQAYAEGFFEFKHFKGRWLPDFMDITGNLAWVTGDLSWEAQLIESGKWVRLSVRSTFIFRKSGDQWRMIYEHSSHRRSD